MSNILNKWITCWHGTNFNALESIMDSGLLIPGSQLKNGTRLESKLNHINRKTNNIEVKNISDNTMLEIIAGLVENQLYDNLTYKKIRIIFWFMTLLGLNDSLNALIKDNEKIILNSLKKDETEHDDEISLTKIFNEVLNDKQLDHKEINLYTIKYYLKTIEDCLSSNLEDIAILLANLRKPYPELIETYKMAVKYENMMYLKFIWEKSINYNKRIFKELDTRPVGIIARKKAKIIIKIYAI